MPRGYMEGPAAEEAERRLEELERGPTADEPEQRLAVFGSTDDDSEPHFLGWRDEVDPDGNGIELYRDRPEPEWPRAEDGDLSMISDPLDLQALLMEAA